jgi:DNA repair protein RadA/Sms
MARAPNPRPRSAVSAAAASAMTPASADVLLDVRQVRHDPIQLEGCAFFADACGQIVQEEAVLIAGAPGSNKSTLARQVAVDLASQGQKVLMILTEETPQRLKSAIVRMTGEWPSDRVRAALANIHVEIGLHDVEQLPAFVARAVLNPHGPHHGVSMIVLDSVQGPGLSANAHEKWQALFQFTGLTRAAHITTLLICHITKRGEIAGPKALEHVVDCTVLIRKAYNRRQLAVLKNRFGPETARPVQLELDPTTVTLRPCPHAETLTAVARGFLPGVGVTEVQGAVTLPRPGAPAKVTAPGLPRKEIEQYLASICQVPGLELADFDLSIQCRLPGERRYRGVLGLPLCLALVASYIQKPIPPDQLHLGEIDLCRNVRDLPDGLIADLGNAIFFEEIETPLRMLCPPSAVAHLPVMRNVQIVPCRRLDDAIFATWPELH